MSLSYKAIPDPRPENRFVIDQDDLVGLVSSVDPAQFEFADGMITKVDYKVSSEVGPIIKETAGLAAKMAAKAAFTGELECQQTLIDELSDFKTEQKTLKQAKARQTEVEGRFFNRPSAAMKLAVERADANVATIQNNIDAHRPVLQITAVATPDTIDTIEFVSDLTAYEDSFNSLELLANMVAIEGEITDPNKSFKDVSPPEKSGYSGLYYRLPEKYSVKIHDKEPSTITKQYTDVPTLHRGHLARLQIDNGLFTNRGYTIQFDPAGGLASYEITSSSIVKDAVEAMRGAGDEADAARLKALKDETAVIKAKKKLAELGHDR